MKMFEKMQERFEKYKIIEQLEEELDEEEDFINNNPIVLEKHPLNQILYGPPGTGKTYHVIEKSVKIANPNFDTNLPRDLIKAEYERLQKNGEITREINL
jgi:5-methylcytosine-specific restriction protein B